MDTSIPYYEDNSRISNSSLGWFLKGPSYFYKKINNLIKEQSTSSMDLGTAVHMYLLQPDEFAQAYEVIDGKIPSTDKQKQFCEEFINSTEIEPQKAAKEAYKRVYVSYSEEKALNMAEDFTTYIKTIANNKTPITPLDLLHIQKLGIEFNRNKAAYDTVNPKTNDTLENHHEFHINWEYTDDTDLTSTVACKSLIDCVTFDFKNKRIDLTDLKTSKNIWTFKDSIDHYDYIRQLMFYKMAIKWYLINERDVKDIDGWEFNIRFIVLDTENFESVRVLKVVNQDIFAEKEALIKDLLKKIHAHYRYNVWDKTIEAYLNNGEEIIL